MAIRFLECHLRLAESTRNIGSQTGNNRVVTQFGTIILKMWIYIVSGTQIGPD